MQFLGILAEARAGLVLEHARQVEAQCLHGGLDHGVGGQDAGAPLLVVGRPVGRLDGALERRVVCGEDRGCPVDAEAVGPVAGEPVAHSAAGQAGSRPRHALSDALVESQQGLRASGAHVAAGGVGLVHGPFGRGQQDAIAGFDHVEGARELGAGLGRQSRLGAQSIREEHEVVLAAVAAELQLGFEPATRTPADRHGDVVEAQLGHFSGAVHDAPGQPLLLEGEEWLERRPLRDAFDALAQLAARPLGRRRVGCHQGLELLATQHARFAGDELLQREAHPPAGLTAAQVVAGGQEAAVRGVEKRVAVAPRLAGVHIVAGESRRRRQTGERGRVRNGVLGLYFHAVTLP